MSANCGFTKNTYVKRYQFPEVSCNQDLAPRSAKSCYASGSYARPLGIGAIHG
jgi:hypothetical protein